MSEALATKYRPQKFADVVGQAAVVRALQGRVKSKDAHCFLLCGPSGVGKTTLARIVAREMGCAEKDIREIDAATYTGIEAMRDVQSALQYKPFGKSQGRAIIVDEAHGLSRQAWNSLLKATEEPPDHVYWFLCTTEAGKVPATIKTRAVAFTLKPVDDKLLGQLFDRVCDAEGINLPGDVGDMIIREALGSPRQMLSHLAACRDAKDRREAAELLRSAVGSQGVIDLCRFLIKGGSWVKAMAIVEGLDEAPESIRIAVVNYFGKAAKGANTNDQAGRMLEILDAFSQPYNQSDGQAPLVLSIGRALFGG